MNSPHAPKLANGEKHDQLSSSVLREPDCLMSYPDDEFKMTDSVLENALNKLRPWTLLHTYLVCFFFFLLDYFSYHHHNLFLYQFYLYYYIEKK